MKCFTRILCVLSLIFVLFGCTSVEFTPANANAADGGAVSIPDNPFLTNSGKSFKITRDVEKGIRHQREWKSEGPFFFNALEIDLSQPHLSLEVEKGQDCLYKGEKVAATARRESRPGHKVVAATNGDFWGHRYTPVGLFVDDGFIYRYPNQTNKSVFVMDDKGAPRFVRPSMKTTIKSGKRSLDIDRINVLFDKNETGENAVLYNCRVAEAVTLKSPRDVFILEMKTPELIPNKACKVRVKEHRTDVTSLPCPKPNELYLAVKKEHAAAYGLLLTPDSRATILAEIPEVDGPVVLALGGIPRIVRDGKVSIENEYEKISDGFCTTRHPRTAIGISKDRKKIFLLVADGRQPSLSIGQSLKELAQYMVDLGAWDAMNLDGGGSSTMWVRDQIVSSPSDATGPRTVTNSLLVFSDAKPGSPASLRIVPGSMRIPSGAAIQLQAVVYDEHMNALPEESGKVKFKSRGNGGVMNGAVFLAAPRDGSAQIQATLPGAGIQDEITLNVSKPATLDIKPDLIMMEKGQEKSVEINALAQGGESILVTGDLCTVDFKPGIGWNPATGKVSGLYEGKYKLDISVGGINKTIPVYVDYFRSEVANSFETPDSVSMSMKNSDKAKTRVSSETKIVKDGKAAVRLDYDLLHGGGTSAVYLKMDQEVPGRPYSIGFWVYGDGKEQWIRGFIEDKDGEQFIADFTNGTRGVYWKDKWQYVEAELASLPPKWDNPGAIMDFPVKMNMIYLVQTRDVKKSGGSLVLDGLSARYPRD